MKRLGRWIWIPIVIVVVALGVLGDAYYQQRQYQAALNALQTQVLAKGTITATVSATGTLAALRTADLSFGVSGTAGQVDVKLGDEVKQGQVLAALDPSSVPSSVNLAKQDLVSAQVALVNAQSSQTAEANAEVGLANAQIAMTAAQTNYNNIVVNYGPTALSVAKNDLQIAAAHYRASPTDANKAYYAAAQQTYAELYAQYGATGTTDAAADASTVALVTAQYNLAKAQLADAQAALKNYVNGVSPQAVAAAQAQVAADEATIAQAEIVAPFDGTITALNVLAGNVATPGVVVISMADRSQLHVDIPISELDISTVKVGESATLNFDAFPAKNYAGQVTAVTTDPAISSGSVTYQVRVVVQGVDASLLPGMTAGVTIVTSQENDVLVVPSRAVKTVNGRQVVYLVRSNQLIPVRVTLGASNDTETVVTGGFLQAGQTIVVNPPATLPTVGGLFGLGRIFGGGAAAGGGVRPGGFGGGGGCGGGGFGGGGRPSGG